MNIPLHAHNLRRAADLTTQAILAANANEDENEASLAREVLIDLAKHLSSLEEKCDAADAQLIRDAVAYAVSELAGSLLKVM